jgi:hypothetical protein
MTVAPATLADLPYIDHLQRKNAEELSFYPMAAFEREVPLLRVLLARVNGEPAGYLYHGALTSPTCKIHQACIQYDLRGYLYGAELVRTLTGLCNVAGSHAITLRCGSDIAANGFWSAMGFECESVTPGGVRRMRDINAWRLPLGESLFSITVPPSERQQDASLWRATKDGTQSQFMRGAQMRAYRAELERRFEAQQ